MRLNDRVRVGVRARVNGVRVGVSFNRVRVRCNRREMKVNEIERETDKNRRNGWRKAQSMGPTKRVKREQEIVKNDCLLDGENKKSSLFRFIIPTNQTQAIHILYFSFLYFSFSNSRMLYVVCRQQARKGGQDMASQPRHDRTRHDKQDRT
jgi:hypothetical protein